MTTALNSSLNSELIIKRFAMLLLVAFVGQHSFGQVYSNKEVGKKNQDIVDSLKTAEYPYILPIWGAKAAKKGYNLPYSAGLGVNYLWQESDLVIENLQVGFNHGPLHNLSRSQR